MLELASDPPDVEKPVAALGALQVDRRDVQAVAEQEVRGGRVAMQPDLPVLPHLRAIPASGHAARELVGVSLPDAVGLLSLPTSVSKYLQSGSKSTVAPLAVRLCWVARKYASALSRQYRCVSSRCWVARAIAWLNSSPE